MNTLHGRVMRGCAKVVRRASCRPTISLKALLEGPDLHRSRQAQGQGQMVGGALGLQLMRNQRRCWAKASGKLGRTRQGLQGWAVPDVASAPWTVWPDVGRGGRWWEPRRGRAGAARCAGSCAGGPRPGWRAGSGLPAQRNCRPPRRAPDPAPRPRCLPASSSKGVRAARVTGGFLWPEPLGGWQCSPIQLAVGRERASAPAARRPQGAYSRAPAAPGRRATRPAALAAALRHHIAHQAPVARRLLTQHHQRPRARQDAGAAPPRSRPVRCDSRAA